MQMQVKYTGKISTLKVVQWLAMFGVMHYKSNAITVMYYYVL